MNSKQLIFLPLLVLGLASCTLDSTPKTLSFDDAVSYINKNSKGKAAPKSGVVSYTCKDESSHYLIGVLPYFGIDLPLKKQGCNVIPNKSINYYIDHSDGTYSASEEMELPLMYLNETNFTNFVKDQPGFSYSLTHIKEFIMYHKFSDDLVYTRYYNSNLRLYKFEIHSNVEGQEYDVTQVYSY